MVSDFHKKDGHHLTAKKKESTRIDIRCTKEEKDLIIQMAHGKNMSISEYVKTEILGKRISFRAAEFVIKSK